MNRENNLTASPKRINANLKNISCKREIRNLIDKWLKASSWQEEDFIKILELVGIYSPKRFSHFDRQSCFFQCETTDGELFRVFLEGGNWNDSFPEIRVKKGEETKWFETNTNHITGHSIEPEVRIVAREIRRDGKRLMSFYTEHFCNRTLEIGDRYVFKVNIAEPEREKPDFVRVCQNAPETEEYLLSLTGKETAMQVCQKMVSFLNFSKEELDNSSKFEITLYDKSYNELTIISRVYLIYGVIQEYAVTEQDEIFHVFKNGNWKYYSDSIDFDYEKETDECEVFLLDKISKIEKINLADCLKRVKEKISSLMRFTFEQS